MLLATVVLLSHHRVVEGSLADGAETVGVVSSGALPFSVLSVQLLHLNRLRYGWDGTENRQDFKSHARRAQNACTEREEQKRSYLYRVPAARSFLTGDSWRALCLGSGIEPPLRTKSSCCIRCTLCISPLRSARPRRSAREETRTNE